MGRRQPSCGVLITGRRTRRSIPPTYLAQHIWAKRRACIFSQQAEQGNLEAIEGGGQLLALPGRLLRHPPRPRVIAAHATRITETRLVRQRLLRL